MPYLIDAGLLLISLLFGILGVKTLSDREKANVDLITKHLDTPWQDLKTPLPPAKYGMSFIYIAIAFLAIIAFVIAVTILN